MVTNRINKIIRGVEQLKGFKYNEFADDLEYMYRIVVSLEQQNKRYRESLVMIAEETKCEQTEKYANSALEEGKS